VQADLFHLEKFNHLRPIKVPGQSQHGWTVRTSRVDHLSRFGAAPEIGQVS
jgi:hypothetical protein